MNFIQQYKVQFQNFFYRAIEICDSDTEDEYNTNRHPVVQGVLNKKRLSFSNEESNSDTSEFDPGDDITQKRVNKKGIKIIYL